jgi:hypothetical protein
MKAVKELLRDRRRAQRGSVLSGVLIMVAFLAIISGALMTELSTHFLISRALVNRVGNEATVSSAMELALDQLQNTGLTSGCPGATSTTPLPPPVTLNGRTAAVSYASCWPTVDVRSSRFMSIATSATFNIDGSHSFVNGQDLYLVGDSGGMVYQYHFGDSAPSWSLNMLSNITGPPLTMADVGASPPDLTDISNLVPIAGGGASGCSFTACVKLLQQDTNRPAPDYFCYMGASGLVTSRPAAGVAYPDLVYFGDASGTLWAYSATEAGHCALKGSVANSGNPIVAGPIVFQNGGQDEIYVVTSTNRLLRYTYDPSEQPDTLSQADSLALPFSNPMGVAVENTSVTPARVAITFAGGGVAMVTIPTNFDPTLTTSAGLGPGIAAPPSWCACPNGPQIGVAGLNGTLYVLAMDLSVSASYPGGSPLRTTPSSDGVGEWFFGADDGYLYEVQQRPPSSTMAFATRFGPVGRVGSSVQLGGCPAGICVYMGSTTGSNPNAYIVPLDARAASITACLTNSPPACSTDNPRLVAQVEVGDGVSPQTVHVQGWSYYSP